MKTCVVLVVLAFAISASAAGYPCQSRWIFAECKEGEYPSPGGTATAMLRPNEIEGVRAGGFLVLTVKEKHGVKLKADDVTGLLWLDSTTLVYSTEEAYGDPALWVFGVDQAKPQVVAGNPGDPNKDSYFELIGACSTPSVLFFNYIDKVSKYSYGTLRLHTPEHLHKVNLDGTGFSTATLDASIIRHHAERCW